MELYRIYTGNNGSQPYCSAVNVSAKMVKKEIANAVRKTKNSAAWLRNSFQWIAAVPHSLNPQPEFFEVQYLEEFDVKPSDRAWRKIGDQYQRDKIEREGISGFLEIFNGIHSIAQILIDRDDDDGLLSAIVNTRVMEEMENES